MEGQKVQSEATQRAKGKQASNIQFAAVALTAFDALDGPEECAAQWPPVSERIPAIPA
jgi:hypothetical protein